MAKKPTLEEIKNKIPDMGNFGDFEKKFSEVNEDIQKRVMPMFQKLSEEQAKLSRPAKRKNLLIDGKNCVISLIVDGRVLVNFPTVNEGEEFFESFVDFSVSRNKWWYRVFTYFKKK